MSDQPTKPDRQQPQAQAPTPPADRQPAPNQPAPDPWAAAAPRTPGTFRVHLLVRDDAGPVQSLPGGTTFTLGTRSRWRFACDPSGAQPQTEIDRGTTEPYAVHCKACKATEAFKKIDRPHPKFLRAHDLVTEE